jgi:very-short-patch-repair endonuclease
MSIGYSDLLVEVRDRNLNRLGALPGEAEWQIADVHLGLGVWEVRIPIEAAITPALEQPGSGIVVTGPNGPLFSGPMTAVDYQATTTDPLGMVIVEGVSDAVLLSDRIAYPDPGNGPLAQSRNFDTRRGPAESVMHQYVSANLGPTAMTSRRAAHLVMGTDAGRGSEVTHRARWEPVGEILAKLGRLAGLGFRRQVPISGYIADFACPAKKLIVEVDGSQHGEDQAIGRDSRRTARLEADGWTVLRFWNDDVLRDMDGVCRHIVAAGIIAEDAAGNATREEELTP